MQNLSIKQFLLLAVAVLGVLLIFAIIVIDSQPDAPAQRSTSTPESYATSSPATSTAEQVATTSRTATTTTATSSEEGAELLSQSAVLEASTKAVARVSGVGISPQAGVLLADDGGSRVIAPISNPPTTAEGLFRDGAVVSLVLNQRPTSHFFAVYEVRQTDGQTAPLTPATDLPRIGARVHVVPLSARPQIFPATVENVTTASIAVGETNLPAGSLLVDQIGQVVGLFNSQTGSFTPIGSIIAH